MAKIRRIKLIESNQKGVYTCNEWNTVDRYVDGDMAELNKQCENVFTA